VHRGPIALSNRPTTSSRSTSSVTVTIPATGVSVGPARRTAPASARADPHIVPGQ
jgi:hypothetical protein